MGMKPIQSILVVCILALLSACSAQSPSELLGDWHVAGTQKYLAISQENGDYSVKLYGPPVGPNKRVRSRKFPAVMDDGVLIMKMPEGDIPVLYNPNTKTILINAQWEYSKLPVES